MEVRASRMCEMLLGLEDMDVLAVEDIEGQPMLVHIRSRLPLKQCDSCGERLYSKGSRSVALKDPLVVSLRELRLIFHKRRWECKNEDCDATSLTEQRPDVAPTGLSLTTRTCHWILRLADEGHSVNHIAHTVGCDWSTANQVLRRFRGQSSGADADSAADADSGVDADADSAADAASADKA